MKILVTGAAGFIGSHLVDEYIKRGHDVIALDNLSYGKKSNVNPKAKFYEVDLRSIRILDVFKDEKPDIVSHHAAQISVPLSVSDPFLDVSININGFLNVLESSIKSGVKKIILASTAAVYGEAEIYPTPETSVLKPCSPYAINKLSSEFYLLYYSKQYNLDYTIFRYSNVYGPRQVPHGETSVVSIFIQNILNEKPSTLNCFPSQPHGNLRDYCFISDVVEANMLISEQDVNGCFNISTGVDTCILDIYRHIYKTLNGSEFIRNPTIKHSREGDVQRICLDPTRALDVFGWGAKIKTLDGLTKTVNEIKAVL